MSVAKALAARTITFLLDGLQGPTNREAREILEQALADAELRREKEVREATQDREIVALRAVAAEDALSRVQAHLSALTAPVDGEPGPSALDAVWYAVDKEHARMLALWRAGAAYERVRTAQLRAEVSEARSDRDKALAELEAANLRIRDLEDTAKDAAVRAMHEPSKPRATLRELDGLADEQYRRVGSGWNVTIADMRQLARDVADRVRAEQDDLRDLLKRAVREGWEMEITGDPTGNAFVAVGQVASDDGLRGRDLAAARARIAELEAPLPEATVEELGRLAHDTDQPGSAPIHWESNEARRERYCAMARAVAERVRRERCLIARAVAANIDVRALEDVGGGFLVGIHRPGEDEHMVRNVPATEVPAELARMLTEVGA